MAERMFGLETEYAFSALGPRGARVDQGRALSRFMDLAREKLRSLPDRNSNGIFLENGSRLYLDCGGHPELAGPELANPWDACRYALAGDRILATVADQLTLREKAVRQVVLTRCNVCYSAAMRGTWGSHESYAHRIPPSNLPDELIPHLVSRVIYSGAGGFDNRAPGIEFMISPRVAHLMQAVSSASTSARGIFHTKDESLSASGCHRLHVLCGESLCSQTALWLKTAITTLVVALAEAGLRPCRAMALASPLEAMRAFAADATCTARVFSVDGRAWTALAVQRHILAQIEAHLDHPLMPPWAPQARDRLRQVLDRLAEGPGGVAKTLDWAIKLSLYGEFARRSGISWESLPTWNRVLRELETALRQQGGQCAAAAISPELLRPNSPVAGEIARLAPVLAEKGLAWDGLGAVLSLRQRLCELDTRFSQLGPQGIFGILEHAGALDHAVPGVDNIEHAVAHPPAIGRARLRGECVRRFHGQAGDCWCDWTGVWDVRNQRYLDLSEPFAAEENWKPFTPPDSLWELHLRSPMRIPGTHFHSVREALSRARSQYDQGRCEDAHRSLEQVRPIFELLAEDTRREYLRLSAWVQARRGLLDGPAILARLGPWQDPLPLWLIADHAFVFRFRGLVPGPELAAWLRKGEDALRQEPDEVPETVAAFREHQGYALLVEGQLPKAAKALRQACHVLRRTEENPRILCRALVTLAELFRRKRAAGRAQALLDEAMAIQAAHDYRGDSADLSLTCLAKLQSDPARARSILADAKAIQTELANRVGQARPLLLEARFAPDAGQAEAIKRQVIELQQQVPALSQCRLVRTVLDRWNEWTSGDRSPDESGDVFWCV